MAAEIIYGLNSYLTFRMDTETFAVNIGNVTKILELSDFNRVPNSQRYLTGIINYFGDVLPVFDGRLKFGFPATERTSNSCILVLVLELDGQTATAGIVVDSVEKVLIFESPQIQTAGVIEKGYNMEFVHGISTVEDELILILNIDKVFSEDEINWRNDFE